ncbi:restriction endonuclease [Paucibacter sp. DJ2R-2]|uniref:restriction endonuclease n=1 Tax=Paucibacter sp. DJ2R-2 TaxID=2893558 RepID=UPI0021E4539F|nr:restriction endonuclease [Paucibacter sp. DJ2R-2]MCV2439851.1 restriction endonuclease [Paucibacter sp. DJ2R-2]
MAGRSSEKTRAARKLEDVAFKILGVGVLLALLPFFLSKSPLEAAFGMLRLLGVVLLIGGGALLVIAKRASQAGRPATGESAKGVGLKQDMRSSESSPALSTARASVPVTAQADLVATSFEASVRPDAWRKTVLDVIEWRRFEALVEALFKQAGFETHSQSHGADGGIDIWLYSRHQPGVLVSLVQCKHWQGRKVGVDKIRELRGVMAAHKVKRGQFATTSSFTADAEAFAAENGVNLLCAEKLLQLIASRTPEQQSELLEVALEGEYWRPTCVNCGIKMVDRVSRNGGSPFWGCSSYPTCKSTLPIRAG